MGKKTKWGGETNKSGIMKTRRRLSQKKEDKQCDFLINDLKVKLFQNISNLKSKLKHTNTQLLMNKNLSC